MKKLFNLTLLVSLLFAGSLQAQFNAYKTILSKVTDSTAATPSGYGAIRYNTQGGKNKWQFDNGSGFVDFGSGGSSFTLTNGNGTTANGTAVDLGGTLSQDATINGGTNNLLFTNMDTLSVATNYGDLAFEYEPIDGEPHIRMETVGKMDFSARLFNVLGTGFYFQGAGYLDGSLQMATMSGSGTRLSLFDGSGIFTASPYSVPTSDGTSGQVLQTNGSGVVTWQTPSGGGLTVGTSTITSGTNTKVLYNNSGVLGEYTVSGSGNVALTNSPVFTTPNIGTATGTASGNLLLAGGTYTTTTGNGLALTSSTLTSGNLVSLTNTGTAAASNTKTVLNVASSGANGTSTQTTYGAQFANTNTGTSSTNIGASFSASGGTNNYAAYIAAGELKFAGGGTIANTSGNLTISSDVNFSSGFVYISGGRSILFNGGDGLIASNSNSQIAFRSNQTTSTKIPFRFYNVGGSYSATSGTQTIIGNEASFAPTSGTAVFNAYLGSGTFNQTGGANGLVTMMHLAPTITAASSLTGFRYAPVSGSATTELAFHATQGSLVMGGATISTSGIFGWNNTTKELKVNGMRIWTDHDTNGKDNTFVGYNSGNLSVSGIDNVGVGPGTLLAVTTGSDNVAFGNLAGALIQDGTGNILAGQFAGGSLVSGYGNIMQGTHAGYVATGSNNIIIGQNAGEALTTGSNNLIIGVDIDPQSNTADNQMTIQNAIFGSGNNGSGTSLSGGNIGFYATTWGTSAAHVISIGNGTAPSTSIVDGVQLYAEDVSSSSELKVRDEAGNVTTLSPHNFSLIEKSEAGAWSHYSEYTNPKTGEREAVNVDMLKLARLIEQLTGEKLVYKTTLKK